MDDTFIITGEFAHSSPRKSIEDRVRETMMEVGLSISVTTVTTAVAFSLGCLSDIPAVRSLCLYAGTTIVVDFIYQITIFIAILVLEERRIEAKRYDICCCFKAKSETTNEHGCQVITGNNSPNEVRLTQGAAERFMVWYSDQLLRPWVKAFVLVSSLLFLAICGYNATQLTQEFTVTELYPADSYVTTFAEAYQKYTSRFFPTYVYFRDVDQSDEEVQDQMINYVTELSQLDKFEDVVPFCWIKDFRYLISSGESDAYIGNATSFEEQVQALLSNKAIHEVYGDNIILDDNGKITASRCILFLKDVDPNVVQQQIDLLHEQREVSASQPVNEGKAGESWSFFTYVSFL